MEQTTNTINIDTENGETNDVYITDSEDKYLLDKLDNYLTIINEKDGNIMATKKYVSLEKLGLYDEKIKGVISAGDTAALDAAKLYADGLADNYEPSGAVATGVAEAKGYTDTEVAKANTAAAEAKAQADKGVADAATAAGKADTAQTKADEAAQAVADLEDYVGDIPSGEAYADVSTVIGYVNKKAEETLAAAQGGSSETAASVKAQLDTYKTENNAKVNKNIEDIAALSTALDEEIERATAAEGVNAAAIKAISDDYLKGSDKDSLEASIKSNADAITLLTNGVDSETIDGVNDLINYVNEHGTEVTTMQGDIAENAEAISGVVDRVDTLEGEMDDVQAAVDGKVEQTVYDAKIAELAGADTTMSGKIAALESAIGESGSVAEDIATAKQEAIAAAAADATTKAGNAESAAKTHADGLNTAMNTRVEALEAIDHDHSNKAELDLIVAGDKAKWDAAAGKAHEHSNLAVLEGITSVKVTEWDKVSGKAEQTALQGEITRATDAEAALSARIDEFIECSQEDIDNLFKA